MEHSTAIKSAHDGTTLEYSSHEKDRYRISLTGPNIQGTCLVYSGEPASDLGLFFRDLATNWRGWRSRKEWSSLEGDLTFIATSDSTGHVSLSVRLRSGPYPFDWSLSAGLLIESGNLEQIASAIEKFVG